MPAIAGIVAALRQRSIGAVDAPILQLTCFSGGDGFFDGSEVAEVDAFSVVLDVGLPLGLLLVPTYACVS